MEIILNLSLFGFRLQNCPVSKNGDKEAAKSKVTRRGK